MAGFQLGTFDPSTTLLVVSGVQVENITKYNLTEEEDRNTSRSGMGTTGVKSKRKARPMMLTIDFTPGAPEVAAIQALDDAGELTGVSTHTVIGTNESVQLFNPTLQRVDIGDRGVDVADEVGDTVVKIRFLDSGL